MSTIRTLIVTATRQQAIKTAIINRGPSGPAGADGSPGADGADGSAGTNGTNGATGATGPQGPAGAAGPTGAAGSNGAAGATGATGPAGSDANVTNANVNSAISTNTSATLTALGGVAAVGTGGILRGDQNVATSSTLLVLCGMTLKSNNGSGFAGIEASGAISIKSTPGGVNFGRAYPQTAIQTVMSLAAQGLMIVNRTWDHANASATPENGTLRTKVGDGTNITGGNLQLIGGLATGSGNTGNVVIMRANAGASGTTLQSETPAWSFHGQTGHLSAVADNTHDIGASGANRPRNVFVGTSLTTPALIQSPAASVTPATNGQLVFEATSNTSVTLKLKGTDGTVRSVVLTLAP